MQFGTCFRTSSAGLKKTKTRNVTRTLKPDTAPSYNLDLKHLGPCKSETLKKLKSSCLQMFFKIDSIKNSAIFTGKHLC